MEKPRSLLDSLAFNFFKNVLDAANGSIGEIKDNEIQQVSIIALAALNVKIANSLWQKQGKAVDPAKHMDKFIEDLQRKTNEIKNQYITKLQ